MIESYLCLNVSKPKNLSISFRKESVLSETVESVDHLAYLEMVTDSKLKFSKNCDIIFKKGQQQPYFLRKLRSFNVNKNHLDTFLQMFFSAFSHSQPHAGGAT